MDSLYEISTVFQSSKQVFLKVGYHTDSPEGQLPTVIEGLMAAVCDRLVKTNKRKQSKEMTSGPPMVAKHELCHVFS